MTKEKANTYSRHVDWLLVALVLYVQFTFYLGTHVAGLPPGWEDLPMAMVAVAGLLGLLVFSITVRTIIRWEKEGG
jgi:membrane protein YdbS with pleckstrin-like domain